MPETTSQLVSLVVWLMIPVALVIILALVVVAVRAPLVGLKRDAEGRERSSQPPGDDEVSVPRDEVSAAAALPYVRERYLMSKAEREFFDVLLVAAPEDWYVFPQVRLATLLMPRNGDPNWRSLFNKIAAKSVDFVLCDAVEIGPRLVVELDDSSHGRADRRARDRFVDAALRAADLPILHVPWQRRYDVERLAREIEAAVGLPAAVGQPESQAPAGGLRTRAEGGRASRAEAALVTAPASGPRMGCRTCGAEVSGAAKHCSHCGVRLEL